MDRDRRRHGGTSATIGRYVHYNRHATQVCVADPAASVFHRNWHDAAVTTADGPTSRIEGIGRPRVEPSFIRSVIDRMEVVEDKASIGAARVLSRYLGRRVGGSTGTNLVAIARIATQMADAGKGSIVSILCDAGERYGSTYYNDEWLIAQGLLDEAEEERMAAFLASGRYAS
jgi:cysteine synthase A